MSRRLECSKLRFRNTIFRIVDLVVGGQYAIIPRLSFYKKSCFFKTNLKYWKGKKKCIFLSYISLKQKSAGRPLRGKYKSCNHYCNAEWLKQCRSGSSFRSCSRVSGRHPNARDMKRGRLVSRYVRGRLLGDSEADII